MAWRDLIADRDKCKQEAYRLTERANSFDKKAEALKNYIEVMMRRAGKDKVKTALYSLSIQNNPESVEEIDRSMIPPQFWKQSEPTLDKQAIKDALKANLPVPGAQLRQTQSLRIR
jgi:spermidine/putrescine-binding protein